MRHLDTFELFESTGSKAAAIAIKVWPKQFAALLEEKGEAWINQQLWGESDLGVNAMADLVYSHFGETEVGIQAWKKGKSTQAKVDRIVNDISDMYISDDGGFTFTDEEWEAEYGPSKVSLSSAIWEAVDAGVF